MKAIEDIKGKRVLLRLDLNVPVRNNKISDTSRIKTVLPTIRMLLKNNNSIVIMSHYGRPKGKEKKYSLKQVSNKLSEMLKCKVLFADSITSKKTKALASKLKPKEILMLENLRYYPGEEEGDDEFARTLSGLGEVYVNDAFSASHRKHASITGVPKFLPSYEGLHFRSEHDNLLLALNPKSPSIAIIGGAKISTKIGIIKSILKKYDHVFIGGAMMFTLLKAQGYCVGKSLVEEESIGIAKKLYNNPKIIVASDVVASKTVSSNGRHYIKSIDDMGPDDIGLDIGPKSIKELSSLIGKCKTVVWNGPLGLVELNPYREGTRKVAERLTRTRAKTIIGGGDTIAIIQKLRLKGYTYVSTSGGAMLEYIENGTLPGIRSIKKHH
ncbi:MAG: phosphoglycerate kinase [Candidatus Woesearchaeota archaeon]